MTSAERIGSELADLVIGDRLELDITDADGFLRLAAAIKREPEAVATEMARFLGQYVAAAWANAGLCPGCGGPSPGRYVCPCGEARDDD
jgi:hypothetical protein